MSRGFTRVTDFYIGDEADVSGYAMKVWMDGHVVWCGVTTFLSVVSRSSWNRGRLGSDGEYTNTIGDV